MFSSYRDLSFGGPAGSSGPRALFSSDSRARWAERFRLWVLGRPASTWRASPEIASATTRAVRLAGCAAASWRTLARISAARTASGDGRWLRVGSETIFPSASVLARPLQPSLASRFRDLVPPAFRSSGTCVRRRPACCRRVGRARRRLAGRRSPYSHCVKLRGKCFTGDKTTKWAQWIPTDESRGATVLSSPKKISLFQNDEIMAPPKRASGDSYRVSGPIAPDRTSNM